MIKKIKEQKIFFVLIGLIVFLLISIAYLSRGYLISDSKKVINPLVIKSAPSHQLLIVSVMPTVKEFTSPLPSTMSGQQNKNQTTTLTPSISLSIIPTRPSSSGSSGSSTTGQSKPNIADNSSSNTQQSASSSNTTNSAPKIVFIGDKGQTQTYVPPNNPPVEITWARYTNQLEHYAIDYPSNWQKVIAQYRGHEAVFIYAPGADPGNPDVQYISFGWSTYFYPPTASYIGSFIIDSVPGTIYTNGSLGSTYIAGVFNYANGFLILNNNVSNATFAYVFNHMILSLDFNTP